MTMIKPEEPEESEKFTEDKQLTNGEIILGILIFAGICFWVLWRLSKWTS